RDSGISEDDLRRPAITSDEFTFRLDLKLLPGKWTGSELNRAVVRWKGIAVRRERDRSRKIDCHPVACHHRCGWRKRRRSMLLSGCWCRRRKGSWRCIAPFPDLRRAGSCRYCGFTLAPFACDENAGDDDDDQ